MVCRMSKMTKNKSRMTQSELNDWFLTVALSHALLDVRKQCYLYLMFTDCVKTIDKMFRVFSESS